MLRFSLGTLLLVVLLVALGCAAMTNPTLIWSQVVFTSTVLLVLTATVVTSFSTGAVRSLAGGFAIFGWGYLLLIFGPWAASIKPQLLTTASIDWLQSMSEETTSEEATNQPAINAQGILLTDASFDVDVSLASLAYLTQSQSLVRLGRPMPSGTYFHQIGQSIWMLAMACMGGLLGRMIYVWNLRQQTTASDSP